MTLSDSLMLLAVLVGPIAAVQVQKIIEAIREKKERKHWIFRVLMSTRASRVSADHVNALNQIDIEFGKSSTQVDRAVLEAWRIYHDLLNEHNEDPAAFEGWRQRSEDAFVELLYRMARATDYDFDKVRIKRGIYTPKAHGDIELAQLEIREAVRKILTGKSAIPVQTIVTPEADAAQNQLLQLMTEYYSGVKPMTVRIVQENGPGAALP